MFFRTGISVSAILEANRRWHLGYREEDSKAIAQRDGGLTCLALPVPSNATEL